jgi:hypothetical protein
MKIAELRAMISSLEALHERLGLAKSATALRQLTEIMTDYDHLSTSKFLKYAKPESGRHTKRNASKNKKV